MTARAFFDAFAPEVDALRGAGVASFWFVRKAPGLRLRFGGDAADGDLARRFDALVNDGAATSWFASVYEPETRRLGGPLAAAAVHRWFDRDTAAWLSWAALAPRARVTPRVVCLAVLSDLFERCLRAPEEVWDAACNLGRLCAAPSGGAPAPAIDLAALDRLSPALAPLTACYRDANAALAVALDDAWRRGALTIGCRALLPFVATFHLNRYRMDRTDIDGIAAAMTSAFDPTSGLTGAAP